jgi:hypothetical protein
MTISYDQVPNFNDKNKWIELESRKKIKYDYIGTFLLPITETKYYREIKNNKIKLGICEVTTFLNQKNPLIIKWQYFILNELNKKTSIEYIAVKMKNGKWAISNSIINGNSIEHIPSEMKNGKWIVSDSEINNNSIKSISSEVKNKNEDIKILQIYFYSTEIWIIFKAKKGWCLRKIKKCSA